MHLIALFLLIAWLAPLVACGLITFGRRWLPPTSILPGYLALGGIGLSWLGSLIAIVLWLVDSPRQPLSGDWYTWASIGSLHIELGYYIDTLTLGLFALVTTIATAIHVYCLEFFAEERSSEGMTDPLAADSQGNPLHRRGRFREFYQGLSFFCFSMLGLVVAGNLLQVFLFWELVGFSSFLLIGFYRERPRAATAASQAFLYNRVGDVGFLIGLMILWGQFGTFALGSDESTTGLFELFTAGSHSLSWMWTFIAGLGIFLGCMGKSAQLPLQSWLANAMEGPTPVSALVHSATMVAAGVYLVARVYPLFLPEVLGIVAYIGLATMLLAGLMALVALDMKRVLAYSTISQLGLMMMGLGLGSWQGSVLHLFTHACFKSLLFLCIGAIYLSCHTNDLRKLGGLRFKMPWTATLVALAAVALSGLAIPGLGLGFSGSYSKDLILAQGMETSSANPAQGWFFWLMLLGVVLSSAYIFRLWFLLFAGTPRDQEIYQHAAEPAWTMRGPLVVLGILAVAVAWPLPGTDWSLASWLESASAWQMVAEDSHAALVGSWYTIPHEGQGHHHESVAWWAFLASIGGLILAASCYGWQRLDPQEISTQFPKVYQWLLHEGWFGVFYQHVLVAPVFAIGNGLLWFDRQVIDRVLHFFTSAGRQLALWNSWLDAGLWDRILHQITGQCYAWGLQLRGLQSGNLRQYILLLAAGTIVLFFIATYWQTWQLAN